MAMTGHSEQALGHGVERDADRKFRVRVYPPPKPNKAKESFTAKISIYSCVHMPYGRPTPQQPSIYSCYNLASQYMVLVVVDISRFGSFLL